MDRSDAHAMHEAMVESEFILCVISNSGSDTYLCIVKTQAVCEELAIFRRN